MLGKPPTIPHTPGVYLFKKGSALLYIGKALDLKKRLSSYFRVRVGDKVRRLRTEATSVEWSETASDIEALIREAQLIRRYAPTYNVLMRDDKSYLYVAITREQFPRVVAVR
ncbi:MAG: excinuclease ABC subunit C, partial [Parcubacteria group bacterium Greene0714_36]